MMTESKLVELVQRIEQKTSESVLHWERTAAEDEYQTTLGFHIIKIFYNSNPENPDYFLSIVDGTIGDTIESFHDGELRQMIRRNEFFPERMAHEWMESIFKNAKRQAIGLDNVLDTMLSQLADPSPSTPPSSKPPPRKPKE